VLTVLSAQCQLGVNWGLTWC